MKLWIAEQCTLLRCYRFHMLRKPLGVQNALNRLEELGGERPFQEKDFPEIADIIQYLEEATDWDQLTEADKERFQKVRKEW